MVYKTGPKGCVGIRERGEEVLQTEETRQQRLRREKQQGANGKWNTGRHENPV